MSSTSRILAAAVFAASVMAHAAPPTPPEPISEAARAREARLNFHAEQYRRFSPAFSFASPGAKILLFSHMLACPYGNNRVLPLVSVLYYNASYIEKVNKGARMHFYIESSGKRFRVWSETLLEGRRVGKQTLVAEVNDWGETHFPGMNAEALGPICAGMFGPYWLEPGDI